MKPTVLKPMIALHLISTSARPKSERFARNSLLISFTSSHTASIVERLRERALCCSSMKLCSDLGPLESLSSNAFNRLLVSASVSPLILDSSPIEIVKMPGSCSVRATLEAAQNMTRSAQLASSFLAGCCRFPSRGYVMCENLRSRNRVKKLDSFLLMYRKNADSYLSQTMVMVMMMMVVVMMVVLLMADDGR